uniref:atlastin-3-like n=1 Tax=Styela clava TaxID=7725 RepID=UPI0019393BE9|nr:atlastin-3-like [Styela clava]
MEAKSVAEITEEGNFELNVGNLTAVLHNPKCQDLAIVSMAGAYRTGKSFMLNFFIRYLRNRGWENESWFGPEDMKIQDGFEWSNGSKPHTLGILVCPEIFYVEKNGKQVGVMIVDTQGLFDASSSPDTNVNIMSISTLLSSHQILNFKNNVRGTDFEHLQLSLKYALAASHSFPRKQKSFQKLTFLVRDWQHPNECPFGHGGDGYIDGILKEMNQSQPENVSQVKKSIRSGFEHVNGFLMPRPNEKIDGAKDFQKLQNSDITGEFRNHIIMLVDSVLNPKNLVVKKMFGQPISANGLINLISEFSKYIQSGKQPKIETLLESAIKANNATALQEAVSKYRCHLKQLVGSSFPSHIELGKHHEKALKEADKVFRSMATLGSENQTQNVLIQVKEECKSIYERKTEEIRFIMVANIQEFRLKAEKIEKKYEDNMSKLPMDISFETLGVKHKEYYSQALCEFKLGTDSFKGILPKDEIYIKKKLMTRMEEFFKHLKQQRETLENMKRFAKEKEKLEIQNVARDCLDIFHLKMIQISGEFIPRIEEACQKEMRSILGKYGRNCERFTDQYEVRKCQNKLKDNLEEHCERAVKNNERNMEMLKSKCAEHSQTAAREYDKKMKNLMGQNQLHEEEFLDAKHSEFKDSAMYRFDDLLQSMSHSLSVSFEDEFKMKLDMAMNEKYQVYKKKNDRERMIQKMEKESKECAHHAKTALSVYTHGMDQVL